MTAPATPGRAEETEIPQPTFPHQAYGVELTEIGDEGGRMARGHVEPRRFLAACNHYGRSIGLHNACDEPLERVEMWLLNVKHVWAVPVAPHGSWEDECDWFVEWGNTTAETPGAIAVTVWEP